MSRVIRPPDRHVHDLPDPFREKSGTLAECGECGQWFVRRERYVGFGFDDVWCRVSWWNFTLRRRIRRAS